MPDGPGKGFDILRTRIQESDLLMSCANNGFAWACRQITDDRSFNVDFALHDFRLGSENRGLSPFYAFPSPALQESKKLIGELSS